MITRIVKLSIKPEYANEFIQNFKLNKEKIGESDGCVEVMLYRDKDNSNIFFTYSIWQDVQFLENYRNSDLFRGIWAIVKPMFLESAQAWTVDKLAQ